ncbi:MAG: NYN domain-containing protein [Candidatus Liptonbacteria bacterium]|nr:NYN domain-containing protein [Candidatus Liptonbacteria bacterium]
MENLECAILLDIENILFAACDDAAARSASKNKLAGYIIGYVSELAQGYAPSVRSYAALGFARKQKNVSWISFALAKAGFRTMIVPAGPNAADTALRDLGLLLAVDDTVGTVILATGDGREPFPELLEILLGCGKRVHVVSYDGAPFRMHIEGVEHSSLAPHLRIFLEEEDAAEPPQAAAPEADEAEATATAVGGAPLEAVGITKRMYREAVQAILVGASIEGLKRPVANLADAYEIYENELAWGHDRRFSFGRLLGVLEAARASGSLQAASAEEVGWIANALVKFTDIFDHLDMYIESANGRFAALLKACVAR